MTTIEDQLSPGRVIRGKYRIERCLGAGGMGMVLEAFHVQLDRRVAIKVLHASLREHSELTMRFMREGQAAARIEGPHVAKVLDVDQLDDGTPFLVMEMLEGSDLSTVRKSGVPLSVSDAVDYVLQASQAIDEAHSQGIIHRDLKPANLFLAKKRDGDLIVKVLDFGISKLSTGLNGSEPSMTRTSLVMGSAEYMSPEQMLSTRDVDARTDIWALGAVLYELLTARPPFLGENMTQVCAMVMSQPIISPRMFRPELPENLEKVILTCLQKDRGERYPDVKGFARALLLCLADLENEVPATTPLAQQPGLPSPITRSSHPFPMGPATEALPVRVSSLPPLLNRPAAAPLDRQTAVSGLDTGQRIGLDTNVPVASSAPIQGWTSGS